MKTITVGVTGGVQGGQRAGHVPKIKQYRVNFDRQNSKFTSACASAEFVDIHFQLPLCRQRIRLRGA